MSDDNPDGLDNIDYSQLRKHNRYNIVSPCKVTALNSNKKTETFLTTISVGGLSFLFPEIIPVGTILSIEFDMPNGSKVNKFIEIKRFKKELKSFQTPIGIETIGFEHGSKFIVYNEKSGKTDVIEDAPEVVPIKPKEEIFKQCFYHIEFYRSNSNVLRHGYAVKMSERHVFFNSWIELQKGETINTNIVMIENDQRKEEVYPIEIKEISKEGKLFSIKGLLLR